MVARVGPDSGQWRQPDARWEAMTMGIRSRVAVEASRLYKGAEAAWAKHIQGCYACHVAKRDQEPLKYCDEGWKLAKTHQATYFALLKARGEYGQRQNGQQMELF